jgi:hypothetical protein
MVLKRGAVRVDLAQKFDAYDARSALAGVSQFMWWN